MLKFFAEKNVSSFCSALNNWAQNILQSVDVFKYAGWLPNNADPE